MAVTISRRYELVGWVILLLAPAAFFLPVWWSGQVYGTFDLGHITIALEDVFARYQRNGDIPVWTPEFHGGFPLMANAFQSFFYAPHLVLRQWLPGVWVANLSLLTHMWLAGGGMYLLLRSIKLPRESAWVGGLIVAIGGYLVGRITLPHLYFAASWIPLLLWAIHKAWQRPHWTRVLVASLIWSSLIFAGHMQIAVYSGVAVVLLLLSECMTTLVRTWSKRWLLLSIPLLVSLLVAVQVLPAADLIGQSRRAGGLTGEEAFDVSYPVSHLLTWVNPAAFGHGATYQGAKNEPELMTYFGWIGLALGMIGLVSPRLWRDPVGRAAIFFVLVGFVLAGGEFSPVYRWLAGHTWLFARLANPGRAIVLVHIGWVIAVAFGFRAITARWRIFRQPVVSITLLLVIAAELIWAGKPVNATQNADVWMAQRVLPFIPARTDAPRIFSHTTLELVPNDQFTLEVGPHITGEGLQQTISPQRSNWDAVDIDIHWNGRLPQTGTITLTIEHAGEVIRAAQVAGESITTEPTRFTFEPIADGVGKLFTLRLTSTYARPQAPQLTIRTHRGQENFNPTGELAQCQNGTCSVLRAADWTHAADANVYLHYQDREVWRERELLLPMFGEAAGQQMVRPHISLQIGRVDSYLRELGLRADFDSSRLVSGRDLYDRFSIGTLLATYPEHRKLLGLKAATFIDSAPIGDRTVHAYRNDQAYPRFAVAPQVLVVPGEEEARQALIAGIPPDAVTIEGLSPTQLPEGLGTQPADLTITQDEPRFSELTVTSTSPQLVVMRDVFYTGWRVFIDEQEASIYPVDSIFRGVLVPSGEHSVRFEFHSRSWRIGITVSAITWTAVVAVLFYTLRLRRVSSPYRTEAKKEAEEDSLV